VTRVFGTRLKGQRATFPKVELPEIAETLIVTVWVSNALPGLLLNSVGRAKHAER
jgi:hypothetical protein